MTRLSRALLFGFHQLRNERSCRGEPHPLLLPARGYAKRARQMSFARAAFADQQHRFRPFYIPSFGQFPNLCRRHFRRLPKIELFQRLHPRQMRFANPSLHHPSLSLFDLRSQQRFQISHRRLLLPHRLLRQLAKLQADGRHPQMFALTAHPSGRFDVSGNHFQLAMLAYNLNCWLMLFNREPVADAATLRHTTLATSRLRFLFVAAKIWRHAAAAPE